MIYDIGFIIEQPFIPELQDSRLTICLDITDEEMAELIHGLQHALLVDEELPECYLAAFSRSARRRANAMAAEEVHQRGFARDVAAADFSFDFLIGLNEHLNGRLMQLPEWDTYNGLRREAEDATHKFFHSGAETITRENARGRWAGCLLPIDCKPGRFVDGVWHGTGNRFKTGFALWTWFDTGRGGVAKAEYSLCLYRHYARLELSVGGPYGHERPYRVTEEAASGIFCNISDMFPELHFDAKLSPPDRLTLFFETLDRDKPFIDTYIALLDYLYCAETSFA